MADEPRANRGSLLRRAAERAAGREFFLASALLPYAEVEQLDDAALAERLGCEQGDLPKLLLCRRPRREAPNFRADVERIAEAFGLEPGRLAEVVRAADALRALREGGAAQAGGWLAAARDREPEPDAEGQE
jgi:hypothetical protein